jgi:hypothetical protein
MEIRTQADWVASEEAVFGLMIVPEIELWGSRAGVAFGTQPPRLELEGESRGGLVVSLHSTCMSRPEPDRRSLVWFS